MVACGPELTWLLSLNVLIWKIKFPNPHVPSEKLPEYFLVGAYLSPPLRNHNPQPKDQEFSSP